jgi:hypothetical protein
VPPPVGILGPGGVPSIPTPVPAIAFAVTDTNLFVQNLTAKTNTAVTLTPDGKLSNGNTSAIAFSPDGQQVAFTTTATDLTSNPLDTSVPPGATTGLIIAPAGGSTPSAPSQQSAPALVPMPFFDQPGNVFVHNLATNSTAAASLTPDGKLSTSIQSPSNLMFSLDERFLYFTSGATDLTGNPPDTAGGLPPAGFSTFNNVFVHDSVTGTTSLLTATTQGKLSSSSFVHALLSPDQHTLYFDSTASNLTPGGPTVGSNLFAATAPFTSDGQVQFASWQTTAKESDGQAVVTVVRSAPLGQPATVNYTVQDGTAKTGIDFKPTSGTPFEGTRTATITLSNPQGVSLGYPTTALYLYANVPPPPTPVPVPPIPVPITPMPIVIPPTPVQNPPTPVLLPPVPLQTPPVTVPVTPTPISPYSTLLSNNAGPGPNVVGLNATVGKRGIVTMVIGFSRAMDPASAGNAANYAVNLQGHNVKVRHGHVVSTVFRPGRTIPITSLVYNPTTYQTTLTLGAGVGRSKLFQFRASGSTGGLVDTSGRPLNSPQTGHPGQDYIVMVGWPTKTARGATATTNGY